MIGRFFERHLELGGFADEYHGAQTIKEIVDNGVDAVRIVEGGKVHVRIRDVCAALRTVEEVPYVFSEWMKCGLDLSEVQVTDNGVGMEEDKLAFLVGTLFGSDKESLRVEGVESVGTFGVGLKLSLLNAHVRMNRAKERIASRLRRLEEKAVDFPWPEASMVVDTVRDGVRSRVTFGVRAEDGKIVEQSRSTSREESKRGTTVSLLVPCVASELSRAAVELVRAYSELDTTKVELHADVVPFEDLFGKERPLDVVVREKESIAFEDGTLATVHVGVGFEEKDGEEERGAVLELFRAANHAPMFARGDWKDDPVSCVVCGDVRVDSSSKPPQKKRPRKQSSIFAPLGLTLEPSSKTFNPLFQTILPLKSLSPTLKRLQISTHILAPTSKLAYSSLAKTSLSASPPLLQATQTALSSALSTLKAKHPTVFPSESELQHQELFDKWIPAITAKVANIISQSPRPHTHLFVQRLLGLESMDELAEELRDRLTAQCRAHFADSVPP